MRSGPAVMTMVALTSLGTPARAAPAEERPILVAAKGDHRPLVVLLHGDRQPPAELVDALRAEAARRDVALFAPACPGQACASHSFWQWNGDPATLGAEVDAVVAEVGADPARVTIVGWSGGASYLGYRFAELGSRYAAVVFLGGGMPGEGCAKVAIPTLFIEGDHNPLHYLAKGLAAALARCATPVAWTLVPGADHAGEWSAVRSRKVQAAIFDFVAPSPS